MTGRESVVGMGSRVVAVLMLMAAPAGALTLDLHSASIGAKFVRIGDIARISGVSPAEADALASVSIGYAPTPGRSRAITVETVRVFALQSGYLPHEIVMTGEEMPVVERPGQMVSEEHIAGDVLNALSVYAVDGLSFRIARVSVSGMLPEGALNVQISPPAQFNRTFYLPVDVAAGGETVRATVTIQSERQIGIVVATRRIERGTMVSADMVRIAMRNAFDSPRDATSDISQIIGRRATRLLQVDAPVTASGVAREPAVRRGAHVVIIASIPGLELRTQGECLEEGGIGEIVRVRNLASKRIVSGRVTAPGEVMIVE